MLKRQSVVTKPEKEAAEAAAEEVETLGAVVPAVAEEVVAAATGVAAEVVTVFINDT